MSDIPSNDIAEPTTNEKPYDKCIECGYLNGARCDGPNFLAMSPERRCEWLQRRRAFLQMKEPKKWSYAYIAEHTQLSEQTVMRIFNDPEIDPRTSNLAAVFKVLVFSWGKYPCSIHAAETEIVYMDRPEVVEELEEKSRTIDELRATLAGIHESYQVELAAVREGEQKKIAHLKEEVEHLRKENDRQGNFIDRLLK